MAKKNNESSNEPVISSIPVPPSDSALVIDLPDGQKLLVGKIESGTVIEVATWRGTGRPDSRTNRLMLGMSNEVEAKAASELEKSEKQDSIKDLKFPQNLFFVTSKLLQRIKLRKILRLIVVTSRKINVNKLNIKEISTRIKSLQVSKIFNRSAQESLGSNLLGKRQNKNASNESSLEVDIEADFQRILDEVSQRRSSEPKKSPRKTPSNSAKSQKMVPRRAKTKGKGSKSGR